jgi:hypothetical protein
MTSAPGASSPPTQPAAGDPGEVERLRAENAALRARLDHDEHPASGRARAVAVVVLIAVIAVAFTGATVGIWARRSLVNEEVFVDRAVPLGRDPAVQAAVAAKLTEELVTLVDPQALLEEALPDQVQLLAGPLSAAVESFIADQMASFVGSEAFADGWERLVTQGHAAVMRVLDGESDIVSATDDALVIDLVPLINRALARVGELSPELFGRTIDVPALTVDDVPAVARERLAGVLGREVPTEFGVVRIEGRGEALSAAQDGVRLFNTLVWVLVLLTVLLIPFTLWLSHRRRRTLLQLTFVLALATVVVRRLVLGLQAEAVDRVQVDTNRGAVDALTHRFVDPLLSSTEIILWVLVAVAVVALVTGPYAWAIALRRLVRRMFAGGVGAVGAMGAAARDERTIAWVRHHRGTLQVVGAALALLVLLVFDLSWLGAFVVLVVLGGYLVAVATVTVPSSSADDLTPHRAER